MYAGQPIDWEAFVMTLTVLIVSIALHEFGHAISADYLGDPGPRRAGRVTLWPDKHFDPVGFIMIIVTTLSGFGLGWGKPVMVNPRFFKHPRRDMTITAACGPLMNLILALIFGLIIRGMYGSSDVIIQGHPLFPYFAREFLLVNLSLMYFNLLPMHPLDGGKILAGFLPAHLADRFDRFMYQWGPILLLVVVFLGRGLLGHLIWPAVESTANLIAGPGLDAIG